MSVTVRVRLPGQLRELAGGRPAVLVELSSAGTVGQVLDALAQDYPAVERRIRDEQGALRRHVNVFVGTANIRDLELFGTQVPEKTEVHVIPAVSGG